MRMFLSLKATSNIITTSSALHTTLKMYNCQSGSIKEEKNIFSRSEIKPCNHMLIGMGWDGIHCGFYPLFLPGITFPSSVGT